MLEAEVLQLRNTLLEAQQDEVERRQTNDEHAQLRREHANALAGLQVHGDAFCSTTVCFHMIGNLETMRDWYLHTVSFRCAHC